MAHIVDSDSLKPTAAAIDKAIKDEVEKFEPSVLKHVDVPEKVVLPSKEDIETEKKHISFVNGVETFDKNKLKPVETVEKVCLPDREVIENEKKSKVESEI